MANLLPEQIKTKLLWSKRIRIISTFFLMLIIGLIVSAGALLPVALYSNVFLANIEQYNDEQQVGESGNMSMSFGKQRQEIIRELRRDMVLLEKIDAIRSVPNAGQIIDTVTKMILPIGGVTVRLIELNAQVAQEIYTIRLSGNAISRSAVVAVREVFENSADFTVIDFPLDNLTPQNNEYTFVIELATKNTKSDNQ